MKTILITLSILSAFSAFSSSDLNGYVQLDGVSVKLTVNMNQLNLGDAKFQVGMYNAGNVTASNDSAEVTILHGRVMENILNGKVDIVEYFTLENSQEIKCDDKSIGFLILATGSSVVGNCIAK